MNSPEYFVALLFAEIQCILRNETWSYRVMKQCKGEKLSSFFEAHNSRPNCGSLPVCGASQDDQGHNENCRHHGHKNTPLQPCSSFINERIFFIKNVGFFKFSSFLIQAFRPADARAPESKKQTNLLSREARPYSVLCAENLNIVPKRKNLFRLSFFQITCCDLSLPQTEMPGLGRVKS